MLPEHVALTAEIERDWDAAGLSGSLLARNLRTGAELGFGACVLWPLASVVKLPLALVLHEAFNRGELDPAEPFDLTPARTTNGPTGVAVFRHPSRVAAEDLVQLALAVSDNAATDVLLDRVSIEKVTRRIIALSFPDIVLRHPMRALYGTDEALTTAGQALTAGGTTPGGGHVIPELDPARANVGTARSLVNLRHEVGVVESDAGADPVAVAVMTRSRIPAAVQLEADLAIGHAARLAVDALLD